MIVKPGGAMNRLFSLPVEIINMILDYLSFKQIHRLFIITGHDDFLNYLVEYGKYLLNEMIPKIHPDASEIYIPIPKNYPLNNLQSVQKALWNVIVAVDISDIDNAFQDACWFLVMDCSYPKEYFKYLKTEITELITTFLNIDYYSEPYPNTMTSELYFMNLTHFLSFRMYIVSYLKDRNIYNLDTQKYCLIILITQYYFNKDDILMNHTGISNYYKELINLIHTISYDSDPTNEDIIISKDDRLALFQY